jgi:hypothetical protein
VRFLLVLAVLAGATAATAAATAYAPPVPTRSQQAIKARTPQYAYAPARVPTGWRYYKWTFTRSPAALRIWFRDKAKHEITFIASPLHGACAAGREKSFQLDGNKVYWSHTVNEQQAWRCVGSVRMTVATSLPPTKFADSGLGIVAASGHRIR